MQQMENWDNGEMTISENIEGDGNGPSDEDVLMDSDI